MRAIIFLAYKLQSTGVRGGSWIVADLSPWPCKSSVHTRLRWTVVSRQADYNIDERMSATRNLESPLFFLCAFYLGLFWATYCYHRLHWSLYPLTFFSKFNSRAYKKPDNLTFIFVICGTRQHDTHRPTQYTQVQSELENVAINDVLPLKAARRDAIANSKCCGASET